MKLRTLFASLAILVLSTGVAFADSKKFEVKPQEFDPAKSHLVQGTWLSGIGCPSGVKAQVFQPPSFSTTAEETITDAACAMGDDKDKRTEGLLLVKTGPQANNAAAGAELKGVKGMTLTELGYDLRKPGVTIFDPRGSHCDGGAPRFNITTTTGFYFLACSSPLPTTVTTFNTGWMRLRWGGSTPLLAYLNGSTLTTVTGEVKSIEIVFDEAQDSPPDFFGLAVLDNIDVNGVLVGRGPTDAD